MRSDPWSDAAGKASLPARTYEQYRSCTLAGNEAFGRADHEAAALRYAAAISLAARLLLLAAAGACCPGLAARALVEARHNAADNLLRLGRPQPATEQLEAAVRLLRAWRASAGAAPAMRDACEAQLPRAVAALVDQLERQGAEPAQLAVLQAELAGCCGALDAPCGGAVRSGPARPDRGREAR